MLLLLLAVPAFSASETALLRGHVRSARSQDPVPRASVILLGLGRGAPTDSSGAFEFPDLAPGLYNIQASKLGFKKSVLFEVAVSSVRSTGVELILEEAPIALDSVLVTASPFRNTRESPLSVRSIGSAEIERFPGGARDISKVLQSVPGVSSSVTFRNDIIVRGGAPNENRFMLDEVEVPNINHFATQGSSGGPVGMINVNFLRDVDLLTSAFPANRGNALSSVMELRLRNGNEQKMTASATVGASDFGVTLDGPVSGNTTLILSGRRSYLQLLFQALGLPFLPTYNDLQFKSRTRLGASDELNLVGLGAIDRFRLNATVDTSELNQYLFDNIPVNSQWNYAGGAVWKHFHPEGFLQVVASRDQLDNTATKYFRNQDSDPSSLTLQYHSSEAQSHVRAEETRDVAGMRLNFGAGADRVGYANDTFQKLPTQGGVVRVNFHSTLDFNRFAVFAQASRSWLDDRLSASLGLRTDFSDYSAKTRRPLDQVSPRATISLGLSESVRLNASGGRYVQLPAYTVLGYRDSLGTLVNRDNGVTYIRANHEVAGIEWTPREDARISVEGFAKQYANYPFLTQDSLSLANLGADFGVIGNAPAVPTSRGRSYGLEFLAQQKLRRGFHGIFSYTFVRSEFTDKAGVFRPSAWDNRHLLSVSAGKQLGRGWDFGGRWKFLGGAPYTPDNVLLSSRKDVWNAAGEGVPDYRLLNTKRAGPYHELDVRLDKKWFFRNLSLDFYVDIQNLYNFKPDLKPILVVDRDPATGQLVTDPNDPTRYKTHFLRDNNGSILPTIGFTVEF